MNADRFAALGDIHDLNVVAHDADLASLVQVMHAFEVVIDEYLTHHQDEPDASIHSSGLTDLATLAMIVALRWHRTASSTRLRALGGRYADLWSRLTSTARGQLTSGALDDNP